MEEKIRKPSGTHVPGKKLHPKEAKVVGSHFKNIATEIKKLQGYLDEIGIRPIGGWRDPFAYSVIMGVGIVDKESGDCTECSIVCFDGGCDCVECTNPKQLLPDPNSIIKVGPGVTFKSLKPQKGFIVEVDRGLK